jgi:hypothetical protein
MKNLKDLIKENKKQQIKRQSKFDIKFKQPFDKKKLEEANLINKINEIIKFRDPILETMEYKEWVGILQNKLVEELDPVHAKMLYEQDMFRAEKVQASRVGRSSAGGVRKKKVTVAVDPFTPADLMIDPADTWVQASDASAVLDGNPVPSLTPGYGNRGALTNTAGSTHNFIYNASVAELNGKPGLSAGFTSARLYSPNSSTYLVSPKDTPFSFCVVWAPLASSSGEQLITKNETASRGWSTFFKGDDNEVSYLYLNGVNGGSAAYPNADTTALRRMMMYGGGGSDVSLVEPTTGIDISRSPGTTPPGSTGDYFLLGVNIHIAEMILVNRVLSSDDRDNLNNYWAAKYG